MRVIDSPDGRRLRIFDYWSELYDFVDSTGPKPADGFYDENSITNEARDDWDLGVGWDGAKKILRDGWQEGADRLRRFATNVETRVATKIARPEPVYDVCGEQFEIGRVLTGEPEVFLNWTESAQEISGRGIIWIDFYGTCSAGVTAETMLRRGSLIAALTSALELGGYSVGVQAAPYIGNYPGITTLPAGYEARVIVKEPGQPLDMARLASMAHPSFSRRIGFRCLELEGKAFHTKFGWGYGYPITATEGREANLVFAGALYGEKQWETVEGAENWILEKLREYGVHLAGE